LSAPEVSGTIPAGTEGSATAAVRRWLHNVNTAAAAASAVAIGIAACILTWEATARYLFKIPSDWQDESSVILLVGATFLSAAWVQEWRGHVGIQALSGILSPRADAVRRYVSDVAALAFCAFFSWKSWTLLHEAVRDGQTSNSSWGAPLWIPYSCMAAGMTLVTLQLLLQVLARDALRPRA